MSRTDSSNRDLLWLHRDSVPWEFYVRFFYLKSQDIVDLIPGMLVRDLRTKYTQGPPFPSTQSRIAFPGHLFGSRTDLHGVSGVGWPTPRVLDVHDRRYPIVVLISISQCPPPTSKSAVIYLLFKQMLQYVTAASV